MSYKLEYNEAIDLLTSVYCLARNISADDIDSDRSFSEKYIGKNEILKWAQQIRESKNAKVIDDLNLLAKNYFALISIGYNLVIRYQIQTIEQLLKKTFQIDEAALLSILERLFDIDPVNKGAQAIQDDLTERYNADFYAFYHKMSNDPSDFKQCFYNVLVYCYINYYAKSEEAIGTHSLESLKLHKKVFDEEPKDFARTILSDDLASYREVHLYYSSFLDTGFRTIKIQDIFVIIYGENSLYKYNLYNPDMALNLFKALADEKRIAILKMCIETPRYNKELTKYFNLTAATLSYHLNMLLDANLLIFEENVNNRFYFKTNIEGIPGLFQKALEQLLKD